MTSFLLGHLWPSTYEESIDEIGYQWTVVPEIGVASPWLFLLIFFQWLGFRLNSHWNSILCKEVLEELMNLIIESGHCLCAESFQLSLGYRFNMIGMVWHCSWGCELQGGNVSWKLHSTPMTTNSAKCFGSFEQVRKIGWDEVNQTTP